MALAARGPALREALWPCDGAILALQDGLSPCDGAILALQEALSPCDGAIGARGLRGQAGVSAWPSPM